MHTREQLVQATAQVTVEVFADAACGRSIEMRDRVDIAVQGRGEVAVATIDPWERPDLVVAKRIMTMPTVIISIEGTEHRRLTGLKSERRVRRVLDAIEPLRRHSPICYRPA